MKSIIIMLVLILCNTGYTQFIKRKIAPPIIGIADCGVAINKTVFSAEYNPSSIGFIQNSTISFAYTSSLGELNYLHILYLYKISLKFSALIGIKTLYMDEFKIYDDSFSLLFKSGEIEYHYYIAVTKIFKDRISFGVKLNGFYGKIYNYTHFAYTISAGVSYKFRNFNLGFVIDNLPLTENRWSNNVKEEIYPDYRIGFSWEISFKTKRPRRDNIKSWYSYKNERDNFFDSAIEELTDVSIPEKKGYIKHNLLFTANLDYSQYYQALELIKWGVEYEIAHFLAIRGGIGYDNIWDYFFFTTGLSIKYRNFIFDYGIYFHPIANEHNIGISYKF